MIADLCIERLPHPTRTRVRYMYMMCSGYMLSPSIPTDEVGALVFDVGSYSTRAGYAGEDTPKVSDYDRYTV